MDERPSYQTIYNILKLFDDGVFGMTERYYWYSRKYKTDEEKVERCRKNILIHKKRELIFNYLVQSGDAMRDGDSYKLTNKGMILKDNMKNIFRRIEYLIKDYPTLLGGLIGGIIGTLITLIIGG